MVRVRYLLSDGLYSQDRRKEERRACRIETVRAISMLFTSPAALAGGWDCGYGESGCIPFTVGEFDVVVGWVIHMESRQRKSECYGQDTKKLGNNPCVMR